MSLTRDQTTQERHPLTNIEIIFSSAFWNQTALFEFALVKFQ